MLRRLLRPLFTLDMIFDDTDAAATPERHLPFIAQDTFISRYRTRICHALMPHDADGAPRCHISRHTRR